MARPVPRPFKYQWGSGHVVEEASAPNEHYEPVLQLLRVEGGDHDGEEQVRFCFYSPRGAFQRHPLVIGARDLDGLRRALASTPRLRELLRHLVADEGEAP